MDGLQGAVFGVKLKNFPAWTEKRRHHASRYASLLSGVDGINTPYEAEYASHNYHIYALHTPHREMLMEILGKNGIASAMHYPVPVHLQEAYRSLGLKEGSFPVAEKNAAEELSLPMFAELTDEQVASVAKVVKDGLLETVR